MTDRRVELVRELGTLRETLSEARNAVDVERRLETLTVGLARDELHQATSAAVKAFAYLLLREIDLKRIQVLIQGKVLDLPPRLIREALGVDRQAEGDVP